MTAYTASLTTFEGLRTSLTHIDSGAVVPTSAPKDNQGDGSCFSPTDLLAAALLSCAATTLCMAAKRFELGEPQVTGQILKQMVGPPRRVGALHGKLSVQDLGYDEHQRQVLAYAAIHCPVQRSLSAEVDVQWDIEWV